MSFLLLKEKYDLVDGERIKFDEIIDYLKGDDLQERIDNGEYRGVARTMGLLDFVAHGYYEAEQNGWEFWIGKNSYDTYAFRNPETNEIEVYEIDD